MRDIHGRYTAVKDMTESVPAWANGCEACKCGIISAPELTGAASFYLERLVQAVDGDIVFCTCQAGQRYRTSLSTRFKQLIAEAKADKSATKYAAAKTHVDIESARYAMSKIRGARVPTMHYEPVHAELV